MAKQPETPLETDPRFPSGPWIGFFLDERMPGKHRMELRLTFRGGQMSGEGVDLVGPFRIEGHYHVESGECHWAKTYLKQHTINYRGYNEGKGIWGVWELRVLMHRVTGGFHIWPEGMPDPTLQRLSEEEDIPLEVEEPELVPVGGEAEMN